MSNSSIIIAGDCCLRGRTSTIEAEQLSSLIKDIQPNIQSADAALINLETTVSETDVAPISKSGPYIKTDARILKMLQTIGFTGVTLANNHFADYGAEGVQESLRLIEQHKIWHVGAGMNAEDAAQIKYLRVGDKNIAVINACENEFTVATESNAGCNALNSIRQFNAIREAKQTADFVLMIIHGGVEHYQLPTPRMQEIYRFFIDAGAGAVINHHQHCYSGYEFYQGKPIVYGLGNFFFDWPGQDANWNEGYMVKLTFDKEVVLELIPYIQNADALGIRLMTDTEKKQFGANIAQLNNIIANPRQLQLHFTEWVGLKKDEYLQYLLPTIGKNLKLLERWHLIPKSQRERWCPEYLTEQRRLLLKSLFQCEAHQDVMNEILK